LNRAQRKSIVLLKNDETGNGKMLPLKEGLKIYIEGIDPVKAAKFGVVVKKPELADVAIIRIKAPSQYLKGTGIMGRFISAGDLDFKDKDKKRILSLLEKVPAVVDIYLDRPVVIPEISAASKALLVNFGANDNAFLDVVFGKFNPSGKLPIELPYSMEAVRNQKEDVPYDSENSLYPFGYGLHY
jgi:beta-glucosidase